jgi:hypothetical protein
MKKYILLQCENNTAIYFVGKPLAEWSFDHAEAKRFDDLLKCKRKRTALVKARRLRSLCIIPA